ncbi:Mothers against decapentaplegic-like protein 7 [Aix galericulata]|nr:Mothers against decapentaplegic-like protein 7 [Aix galericulata]
MQARKRPHGIILFFDSQVLQEPGDRSHWCVVAYWEEKTRVGRLYSVQEPSLDIFYDLPQGNGFCLGQLNSDNKSQLVQKVRSKIGYGIQLTKEVDGVWVYNRSSYPIFIKSATLDNPDSRTLLVHKVFPGFSIKAFDYEKAYSLQRPNDHEFMQQPWTGFTVQISFVKGWGQCYTRQFISSCPCCLEILDNHLTSPGASGRTSVDVSLLCWQLDMVFTQKSREGFVPWFVIPSVAER